ncbi:MAG: tetratricopeptide repeat protein [Luminiphilus sp.]|jgi:tetratricopeptide (TPR) repeat protein
MLRRHILSALFVIALSGCSTLPEAEPATALAAPPAKQSVAVDEPPETPIPEDNLLPLLQAEFALRARDYNQAVALLTEQAAILTDPALARRALRLAEFVTDAERAAAMAVRLVELDPADGAAQAAASGWLSRTGRPVAALEFAGNAYELGHPVNVATTLGNYEQMDDDSKAAIAEALHDLATRWPDDNEIAIASSLLARLEQDWRRAESFLLPVLERSPEDVRAIMLWTQLQLDQAVPNPLQRLEDAVAAFPANQELRLQYARLLGSEGDYTGAREQFALLLEVDPANPELLSTAALLDFELEFFDAAQLKFEQLIALGERPDEAHYYIGRIEMSRDRYPEAIESFAQVGPSREFRDAKARAATLLADTAFASDIRDFFEAQRRAFPGNAEQLFLLEADALRDWDGEALKAYDRGLTAFPRSFSLLYGRAMVHEADGELTAMETDLRRILEQDPNHAATLNALGYTLTNYTERYEEAADLIERALALSPGDPAILDSLGWVYYKLGQLAQSEALLRQAHQAFPDPEVAAHLGEVLWIQGKQIEARDIWRDGLSRVPDHSIILEAVQRLGAEMP